MRFYDLISSMAVACLFFPSEFISLFITSGKSSSYNCRMFTSVCHAADLIRMKLK
jgi:hypothetical protein